MRDEALAAVLLLAVCSCTDANQGIDPPIDRLYFPGGLVLDPRTPEGEAARYLIVSNGNNDLSYNSGSIVVIDLEAFFSRWAMGADDPASPYAASAYCEGPDEEAGRDAWRCVLDVGSRTSRDFPCRRLGLLPQVVECDERPFVVDAVRIGDFATVMATSKKPDGTPQLLVPVRGDPSITWMEVGGDWPDAPDLQCVRDRVNGRAPDGLRCDDDHRMRWLRNDDALDELEREPFNIAIAEGEGYRYALVAHAAGDILTVVDLDGLLEDDGSRTGVPAIVDISRVFSPSGLALRTGGFGLAQRPCGTCVEPDDPPGTNVPTLTQGCTRPMIYGAYRYELSALNFTVDGLDPADLPENAAGRDACEENGVYYGQFCASPEQIGEPCAVICEPQVRNARPFPVAGVDPLSTSLAASLGDIAFGDECGDFLYLVQTNPGALLRIDTSLDIDNETRDNAAGPPLEVCDQPTRFAIWRDAGYAFVSCYQSAYLYVVDLSAWAVVDTILAGTGPHDIVVDEARQMLYAANALEASISVVDLGVGRPTRFKEVARIGLQEPFRR